MFSSFREGDTEDEVATTTTQDDLTMAKPSASRKGQTDGNSQVSNSEIQNQVRVGASALLIAPVPQSMLFAMLS